MAAAERTIDLNADLGEGFPNDEALLDRVTSASIACGAHAGDHKTIASTIIQAKRRKVILGAHPGYRDRARFGRRDMSLPPCEIEELVFEQVEFVAHIAALMGRSIRYIKPHGALYNQAQREEDVAGAVIAAVRKLCLPLLGQPGTLLAALAWDRGVWLIPEGFPDRRYEADGRLAPRNQPDAVLHDPAEIEDQVFRLVEEGVMTLCIHGDDPRAVANADTVRAILRRHGIALKSFI
jgi:UPF0271 protein